MQTPHATALSKAKIHLMSKPDSAFFTTICFSMKHIWDDSIPTACTDGKEIRYNPQFFMALTYEEQVFLILHESMHVAYLHMTRLGNRIHSRWNAACDYVINLQLVDRGYKMPSCGLLDQQYRDMSADQVYKLLPDNPPNDMEDIRPCPNGTEEQLTADVQDILVRAAIASKMAGNKPGSIPSDIEIYLDKLLNPKLPWTRLLQRYLSSFSKNDYTFRKPNRRFFPKYHMPTLYGEKLIDLAIAVDTSGSVSDEEFKAFITEVASILRMMKPDKITLLQFDTAIKSINKVRNVKELETLKFTGRGGTLIHPVLDWAEKTRPQLLLIFSDGGFTFRRISDPGNNILWVIHNNANWKAPFGRVIHYSI